MTTFYPMYDFTKSVTQDSAEVSMLLPAGTDVEEEHMHAFDPHIWLDSLLAQEEVITIKEGLIIADPENQESYEANAVPIIKSWKH